MFGQVTISVNEWVKITKQWQQKLGRKKRKVSRKNLLNQL